MLLRRNASRTVARSAKSTPNVREMELPAGPGTERVCYRRSPARATTHCFDEARLASATDPETSIREARETVLRENGLRPSCDRAEIDAERASVAD